MWAAIAAAVVAAIGYFGARSASKSAQKTAQYNTDQTISANKELAEYQFNKQLEVQNMANKYNSPEEQQKRLTAAGLNKNLVYGSGQVAGNIQGQLPQYNAPRQEYNYAPDTTGIGLGSLAANSIGTYQDVKMQQAQTDLLRAQQQNVEQRTSNDVVNQALTVGKVAQQEDQKKLLQKSVEQAQFNLDNSYGLRSYQFQVKEEEARQAEVKTKLLGQDVGLKAQQSLGMRLENEFKKNRNKLAALGITNSTNPWLSMILQMADKAGLSLSDWLDSKKK